MSKRRGVAFLKNIKGVASGFIGEREAAAANAAAAATNVSPMSRLQQLSIHTNRVFCPASRSWLLCTIREIKLFF